MTNPLPGIASTLPKFCHGGPYVRIIGATTVYYSTLQTAYDAAGDGDIIEIQAIPFIEDLYIDANKSVTMIGGYDSEFLNIVGHTTINGNITNSNGTLTLDNFIVQTNDTILTEVSSYDTFGQAQAVLKDGNIIYVADGLAGLVVLRIEQYNALSKIASLSMNGAGHAYSFAKKGNYLYMAAREEGIYIIDVSNPASPVLVNTIVTQDKASYLSIDQNLLFASAGSYFVILDISDPINPIITGQAWGASPNQHLIIENNLAYVAAYNKGLRIIDISNPYLPVIISETDIGYSVRGVAKYRDYIYLGGSGSGLFVYNVANPSQPSFVTNIYLPDQDGQSLYDIAVWDNYLLIADGDSGLQIVDIAIPDNPVLVDFFECPGSCRSLLIDNLSVLTANFHNGVHFLKIFANSDRDGDGVLDSQDLFPDDPTEWADTDNDCVGNNSDVFPTNPTEWADADVDGIGDNTDAVNFPELTFISSYDSYGQARGTLKEGNIIYVANGTSGLQVLQIAVDGSLSQISSYPLVNGGRARYLVKINQYLYMACREEGLLVLDVSNPANPQLVYTYDTPGKATFLTLDGTILYLSDRNSLQTFDVSIPKTPQWLGELLAPTEFEHVVVADNIAYIAAYYSGLFIVDVSDPTTPVIIKTTGNLGRPIWAIEKVGNYLFTGGEGSGLIVFDILDPYNPVKKTVLPLPSLAMPKPADQPPFHMKALGSYLFVADGYSGIQVVDISVPLVPVLVTLAEFSTPGYTQDFSIDGYTMIIGDYNNGIHVVNLGSNLDHDSDGIPNYLDSAPLDPLVP